MKMISFYELKNSDAEFHQKNSKWATHDEMEEAKRLSKNAPQEAFAFLTDDGRLLVAPGGHDTGRFPLVTKNGMSALWDTDIQRYGGKLCKRTAGAEYTVRPFVAVEPGTYLLNTELGMPVYDGYHEVLWGVIGWKD